MSKIDPIFDFLDKITMAFVMVLGIIFLLPPALNMFGIFSCDGCDALTIVFGLGFLPVAFVFIGIYFVWKRFASKG